MSLANVFDIAGTALSSQTIRLNTTASNIANAQSVSSSTDRTYKARHPIFGSIQEQVFERHFLSQRNKYRPAGGVEVLGIVESNEPLKRHYQPEHPMADGDGYVAYPNVNIVEEMANMISASRSFQVNVEVLNATKTMMQRVLAMGQ